MGLDKTTMNKYNSITEALNQTIQSLVNQDNFKKDSFSLGIGQIIYETQGLIENGTNNPAEKEMLWNSLTIIEKELVKLL